MSVEVNANGEFKEVIGFTQYKGKVYPLLVDDGGNVTLGKSANLHKGPTSTKELFKNVSFDLASVSTGHLNTLGILYRTEDGTPELPSKSEMYKNAQTRRLANLSEKAERLTDELKDSSEVFNNKAMDLLQTLTEVSMLSADLGIFLGDATGPEFMELLSEKSAEELDIRAGYRRALELIYDINLNLLAARTRLKSLED